MGSWEGEEFNGEPRFPKPLMLMAGLLCIPSYADVEEALEGPKPLEEPT